MTVNDTHADTLITYAEHLQLTEALVVEVNRERARADQATAIVERFHEAWWNWNPGDETEPLDAAASEAMCFLGTVISLNPESA